MSFYKRLVTDYYRLEHVVRAEEWERLCVARERFCFLPLVGVGFLLAGCRGLRFLLQALLLWDFACCRSMLLRTCASAVSDCLWGASLR